MKKKKIIIFLCLIIIFVILGNLFLPNMNTIKADMVIYGNIYTGVNGVTTSSALAIKDGKYIYIGNKDYVKNYISKDTEVLRTMVDGVTIYEKY